MMDWPGMKMLFPCLVALGACSVADSDSNDSSAANIVPVSVADGQTAREGGSRAAEAGRALPAKYVKAFMCDFDENPIAAADRIHKTQAGRAERAGDLTMLRALGFRRESQGGDLESVGGKIAAPPGLTILGLPVSALEINGMIGDYNALYVTTFADGVSVAQVVNAARLEMNRASFAKYKIRHYSRRVGTNPVIDTYLDERGGRNALLSCQVQSTPD